MRQWQTEVVYLCLLETRPLRLEMEHHQLNIQAQSHTVSHADKHNYSYICNYYG